MHGELTVSLTAENPWPFREARSWRAWTLVVGESRFGYIIAGTRGSGLPAFPGAA
jgi:hypothetical protein